MVGIFAMRVCTRLDPGLLTKYIFVRTHMCLYAFAVCYFIVPCVT